ncbi:Bug family tripartite tricarboxylate transporter substrate binding protein [Azohydromonas lata]|uniref:Tripartite tricarboxylate transporter substrate binding protein n=1 Tax=Azohydromonas lata TaxID=45677 RepID=A0ABU5IF76_9BURK|nr:tripartite tricarboxylate transporter substrate binding protein [Azohydromonas lata]MDZ5457780.1 tripartite tricarboxylate transporter substrate binding protein [Azohydromonas lata]
MKYTRRTLLALTLAAAACGAVQAQGYPSKPITWVVPFAPGGSTDVVARTVAQHLQAALKQGVVVDNRAGAGGVIGVSAVAKAAPDGYTLIGGTISTHAINASLYKNLPYDPVKDFEPISLIAYVPNALMVNAGLGVSSVQELVAWIKAHPKEASYASSGAGTSTHLTGALLADTLGVPMQHVPYKGSPQALQDVVAGNVPFLFDQLTAGLPLAKGGKLKVLAVTSQKRNVLAPDVPTMVEAGMPGFNLVSWQAVYAPKGTPKEITQRLATEIAKVLQMPEVKTKLEQQFGMEVVGGGPEQLAALMRTDIPRLGALVKKTGASAE